MRGGDCRKFCFQFNSLKKGEEIFVIIIHFTQAADGQHAVAGQCPCNFCFMTACAAGAVGNNGGGGGGGLTFDVNFLTLHMSITAEKTATAVIFRPGPSELPTA